MILEALSIVYGYETFIIPGRLALAVPPSHDVWYSVLLDAIPLYFDLLYDR